VTESFALVAGALIVLTGLAMIGVGMRSSRSTALEDLLAEFEGGAAVDHLDQYSAAMTQGFTRRLLLPLGGNLTGALQNLLPRNHLASIRRRLVLAGVSGRLGVEEYVAAQVVGLTVGALLGLLFAVAADWSGARIAGLTVGLGAFGFFAPPLWVKQNRDLRVEAIERELPDVLDVLAISVEAGVGLEGAIQAVTERFQSPLADELGHMLSEMELGLSRREALQNLRSRTEIPDLSGFILALLQADALGMPMTRVLQTQAEEMRRRRRAKVREAAAKLPVKLIFPLVMFILPALFIVILGPAALRISKNLM
jgi:tight adherence protein C